MLSVVALVVALRKGGGGRIQRKSHQLSTSLTVETRDPIRQGLEGESPAPVIYDRII
jgi:hypothetical protein